MRAPPAQTSRTASSLAGNEVNKRRIVEINLCSNKTADPNEYALPACAGAKLGRERSGRGKAAVTMWAMRAATINAMSRSRVRRR